MKLEEFLHWDDGTDTRYELVRGKVGPLGIASATHSALVARLGAGIHDALKFRPEHVALLTSALAIPGREDTCYLADIVVAPTPARWADTIISDPVLAIEVASPETYRHDMLVKRPDHMSIRSLKEIVCVDSHSVFAEVFSRAGEQWFSEIVQGRCATLSLMSIGIEISMAELYDGLPVPAESPRLIEVGMLHRLYAWILGIAAGPNALPALLLVSFAESSVFPIPPDILLIPMILARPREAWRLAAYCTLASVAGGLLGYAIGYFLFDTVGRPILEFYHAMDRYDALKAGFDQWGVWIIILKGMTPIPYKLITIASGVAHFDLGLFIGASIVSRSLRFFLVAAILWQFGDAARRFIERRLTLATSLFAVALVGGFVALRYL